MSDLEFRRTFRKRLSVVMRDKNMTQNELATMTGISRYTISTYIRGTGNPTPYNVFKILSVLNCTETEFTYIGGIYTREIDRIEKFDDRLQEIMEEGKLTVNEVSEITGVCPRTIRGYLHKETSPNVKRIAKIAEALGCDIEEFVDFDARLI